MWCLCSREEVRNHCGCSLGINCSHSPLLTLLFYFILSLTLNPESLSPSVSAVLLRVVSLLKLKTAFPSAAFLMGSSSGLSKISAIWCSQQLTQSQLWAACHIQHHSISCLDYEKGPVLVSPIISMLDDMSKSELTLTMLFCVISFYERY